MKNKIYRLGEYKILCYDTGQLTWEAHSGFGKFKTGPCFKKGDMLLLGPPESCEKGFLKGEFLDSLKGLMLWQKTRYYCHSVGIRHCVSNRRVSTEDMLLWMLGCGKGTEGSLSQASTKKISSASDQRSVTEFAIYRLCEYEIEVTPDGQIKWRTYSGPNSGLVGQCILIENIIFIGPSQYALPGLNKRQFLSNLRKLPIWHQTEFFCKSVTINECKAEKPIKGVVQISHPDQYPVGDTFKELVFDNDIEKNNSISANKYQIYDRALKILGSLFNLLNREKTRVGTPY